MRVLIACEYSGIVREAFKSRGHDAWSCDLLPSEIKGNHIQDDVLNHLDDGWDLMIAHPPCTRLCNSGVTWLDDRDLWQDMVAGAMFFKAFLDADIEQICVENPIPHQYALDIIGRKYDQIIQPWMFGDGFQKATCLWLKNLLPLNPTNIVSGRIQEMHYLSPSEDRGLLRSKTYKGIAKAMAEQWG